MPEDYYDRHFPNLKQLGFKRSSEPAYYNCIAYVVHDERRKWWPGEYSPAWSDDYWPEGVPHQDTVAAFVQALRTADYVACPDGQLEEGVEKAAIYALEDGKVTHAARQETDGTWRSKLGSDEDIEHTLPGLVGPLYGNVVAYLKRPRPADA
jgi:hypothetical protein